MAERVIVGLSGGVDSAVAALLLLERGYRVEALFMKNWEEDDTADFCSAAADLADARQVADTLGIRLHTVNFATEYWDRVFSHFLAEYQAGRTPNPDILCNREIKFRAFLDHALTLGADRIATGHYAGLRSGAARHRLLRASDEAKDQSYFLHLLGQEALARSLFPLAEFDKASVRARARAAGLANHAKKDSTGICFIGERRFARFLERFLPARPGPIIDSRGREIGRHNGLMYYTIGQRQGLGIGGRLDADERPWFVVDKRLDDNRLVVAQGGDNPLLYHRALTTGPAHWIGGHAESLPSDCLCRTRHRQPLQRCRVEATAGTGLRVRFERPQRALTPGQSVVFYRGDECLGGAVIAARELPLARSEAA